MKQVLNTYVAYIQFNICYLTREWILNNNPEKSCEKQQRVFMKSEHLIQNITLNVSRNEI